MKDIREKIIYVGKAKDLRNRVRSYFGKSRTSDHKVFRLRQKVVDIEYIVTDSAVEALILESNLIKEHKPRYNVNLKDDKRYPYIKITLNEPYPRIIITRKMEKDGARYFGPYTAVEKMHASLNLVRKIFTVRSCDYDLVRNRPPRECLDYFIKKCQGPCQDHQSREEYREMVDEVISFLSGKTGDVLERVEEKMMLASEQLRFEDAAGLRDQMIAVRRLHERQRVQNIFGIDQDIISFSRDGDDACAVILQVRGGKLLGRQHFYLKNVRDEEDGTILSAFISQFYLKGTTSFPQGLLLPFKFEDLPLVEKWFEDNLEHKITIHIPKKGDKAKLVRLASKNSDLLLEELKLQKMKVSERVPDSLKEVQKTFKLKEIPRRLVCFDISTIQGTNSVGSMAFFENGRPKKSEYRRFKIKTVEGQDDFAMIEEVVERYFSRSIEENKELPNMVVIDGGKGQLGRAVRALKKLALEDLPVISLAKREEEIFMPDNSDPLVLSRRSPTLKLLQQIRDEAHRFGVTYHRKLREKSAKYSILDDVPGIGPNKKRALINHFGSVKKIKEASVEDIAQVPGFSRKLAETVLQVLNKTE